GVRQRNARSCTGGRAARIPLSVGDPQAVRSHRGEWQMSRFAGTLKGAKGWRTLFLSLAVAIVGILQSTDWPTLIPESSVGPVMVVIGVTMAVLRLLTNGPIGRK